MDENNDTQTAQKKKVRHVSDGDVLELLLLQDPRLERRAEEWRECLKVKPKKELRDLLNTVSHSYKNGQSILRIINGDRP
jgi:hypothetical protein